MRDLLPTPSRQTTLTHDPANGLLVADYRWAAGLPRRSTRLPSSPSPRRLQAPLRLERLSADTSGHGRRRQPQRPVPSPPLVESPAFEVGLYCPSETPHTAATRCSSSSSPPTREAASTHAEAGIRSGGVDSSHDAVVAGLLAAALP